MTELTPCGRCGGTKLTLRICILGNPFRICHNCAASFMEKRLEFLTVSQREAWLRCARQAVEVEND